MMRKCTIVSFTLAFLAPTFAQVTPKDVYTELKYTCSALPRYNATTDTAGPFNVVAEGTGASFDGIAANIETFTNDGKDLFGFLTLPKAPPRLGSARNTTLQCTNGTFQALVRSAWVNLFILGQENWQSGIGFGLATPQFPGFRLHPAHHLSKNTSSPINANSTYLGSISSYPPYASSTFYFKYNWGGNAGEYYLLRWLEDGEKAARKEKRQDGFPVLDDRDYVGFLKLVEV